MTREGAYDILIAGGTLLPLNGFDRIDGGWVAVRDGRVAALGGPEDRPDPSSAARTIDAAGALIMPGLVNGHVHAAMTVFRGLADDLPLMTWLNEYIFPAEAAHAAPGLVYWGALLASAEMLLAGTTSLADGYFHEIDAARAFHTAGLRAVAGQGVIDFPAPGVPDPSKNIETAARFIEECRDLGGLVEPSVFCHSPYTCSADTLVRGKDLAREKKALFQIHVSEAAFEVAQSLENLGKRPVQHLDDIGILDENTLVVHGVHLSSEEIDILAERKAAVCTCPESNMKLASGMAPVPEMLAKNISLALGTDGPASNNDLNIFGEMRSLALMYKASRLDPTVLPAGEVLEIAGPKGAAAIGLGDRAGCIAVGRPADIVVMDMSAPGLHPVYNPVSHLVYAAGGREASTVLIDGRIVVENGRILTFDPDEAMARVRELSRAVRGA